VTEGTPNVPSPPPPAQTGPPRPFRRGVTIFGTLVIAAVAAAGQSVAASGANFGAAQGGSYLALRDGSNSWGPPGDSPLQISSWSDSQIAFTAPDGQPPVTPGTTATVQVAVPWSNGLTSSNVVSLVITGVPVISRVSVSQAAPGTTVILTGRNFCAQQGNGYVQVSNNQATWGNPGAPGLTLVSWSDDQIVFTFPRGTTCGMQAQISVTNAAGLTSNNETVLVTSGAVFPVSLDSGQTNIGGTGDGHMDTVVTIQANGALTASTHVWDTSGWDGFTGFHGATVITIFDANGHQLEQWSNGPFGVEGGQGYYVPWGATLSANALACIYSISIVNFYDPQWNVPGAILNWIIQNGPTIASVAVTIIAAS